MQALELETEIDDNQEIHLKLPANVRAGKVKIVVLYEETSTTHHPKIKPRTFGQFRDTIRMRDDFDAPLSEDFWLGGNP